MGKNKGNQFKNKKNVKPKAEAEFADENGLKKVALKAQRDQNR